MTDELLWNRPIDFGKYAMSKWKDLPGDYLDYLVSDECHTPQENKRKALIEIQRRLQGGEK
jgi:uncharacterized protein (DUF3820 family)